MPLCIFGSIVRNIKHDDWTEVDPHTPGYKCIILFNVYQNVCSAGYCGLTAGYLTAVFLNNLIIDDPGQFGYIKQTCFDVQRDLKI